MKMTKKETQVLLKMKDEAAKEFMSYYVKGQEPPVDVSHRFIILSQVWDSLYEINTNSEVGA